MRKNLIDFHVDDDPFFLKLVKLFPLQGSLSIQKDTNFKIRIAFVQHE